jgi:YVTN family beta-propeller protein
LPIRVGAGPSAVVGADGSVWVANTTDRTVSRVDTATNEVVATIPIGNAPAGLALTNDLLWVAVQTP